MLVYIIGLAAGIIGGMGIGGGTILIPALIFFLNVDQQIAQSVNLLSFIPAAAVAIFVHNKNKNIEKKLLLKLIILGCIGALVGSFIAVNLDQRYLRKAFGIFLFFMGTREIFSKCNTKKPKQ